MIQALSRLADERVVKPFEFALPHILLPGGAQQ